MMEQAVSYLDIRRATMAARLRTGRNDIGTQIKQGRFQVVKFLNEME